ncbi:MAG: exonuclease SbcCD subunit D [Clostridia bacterium]|nr:exonuclease SbcCD subunit D [Clostridia bacterium]
MKFVHISDLHLGKRLHETSLVEDQAEILRQIIGVVDTERPDGVLIAGDVYDKSMPSAEAVQLFDAFLAELAARRMRTFVISGNHDSPERIAFGGRIMDASGIHLSHVYDGGVKSVSLTDEYGEVCVYMLPFIKPAHVRRFYEEEEITSYTDAVRVAVSKMGVDKSKRNILITHQFVTGATRSDSEETVGGTDNVDASVFDGFEYVALGHLHGAQNCGSERIRYCGTPLKYSFSEANDEKSVTVVELGEKGSALTIRTASLNPIRDLRKIKGAFAELIDPAFYRGLGNLNDYVQITLTDEDDVPNAMGRLQTIYKNALELKYDNTRTRAAAEIYGAEEVENKSMLELFSEFFALKNGAEMSDEQRAYMQDIIEKIEEESV